MSRSPDDFDSPFADPVATLNSSNTNKPKPHQQVKPVIESSVLNDYNPFEAAAVDLSGQVSNTPEFPPPYSTLSAHEIAAAELERRQKELDAQAAELARREEEQNRLAAGRHLGSGPVNNWPPLPSFFPCKPCFYQDINIEVTTVHQKIVKFGYYLWTTYAFLLLLNLLGSLIYFAGTNMPDAGTVFGVAILTSLVCIPLSYVFWFRPLYKAFRSNSSVNFFIFFFVFGVQVVVMGIQSLGISNWGSCGWLIGLAAVKQFPGIGAFVLIIACIFTGLTVSCAFYLIRVHHIYRSTGASFDKAREEFTRGIASEPAVQSAVVETGLYAARHSLPTRN